MGYVTYFRCFNCGNTHSYEEIQSLAIPRCSECGSALDAEYDYDSIRGAILKEDFMRSPPRHWKYWAFMPVHDLSRIVTMGEGGTPLLESRCLTKSLGVKRLLFKYEAMNPTGSFKDRGSSLELSKAIEFGKTKVVLASTGNMGASVAAYAAYAGLGCTVFIPRLVSAAKITQIRAYGAHVEQVDGDYAVAMERAEEHVFGDSDSFLTGDYPWRCEGTKTIGFEIIDQLYFCVPDFVVAPIGNGTLMWSLFEAFRELKSVGLTDRTPQMVGVQVESCKPVVSAWERGEPKITPVRDPQTVATAIACGDPIDGLAALKALRESGGMGVSVSDGRVLAARDALGRCGIFAEPSGAVSYAGALALREKLSGTVVCVATGHGLKDMTGIG